MFTLESTLAPDSSGLGDWIVQSSLVEDLVDGCVAYGGSVVVAEVAFDAAWSPVSCSPQLEDELRCWLRCSMYCVGPMGLDV